MNEAGERTFRPNAVPDRALSARYFAGSTLTWFEKLSCEQAFLGQLLLQLTLFLRRATGDWAIHHRKCRTHCFCSQSLECHERWKLGARKCK